MRDQDRQGLSAALGLGAALATALAAGALLAAEGTATLRKADILEQPAPPHMARVENKDLKRARNYPEQPPTIPHHIRDYQIDRNVNKCLTCHSRTAIEQSQAPMVSVTHFMDRDGQVRAAVSPRRYFCLQCHVPQTDARPLVGNTFKDVDAIIRGGKGD
ncbi:MAG: periplasmic nitrate reductase electron transfer subunit [Rhodospirillales bacterium CG15_BIG_FIL_POST_REV_8_21_14_020_66_15]|nr:MAG: periplasmic nitrate reductase electron transfer subunit [Rhodospirillales bacterium CG15_BIG_FIL_POST_REV_8_21_14_020_66_15]